GDFSAHASKRNCGDGRTAFAGNSARSDDEVRSRRKAESTSATLRGSTSTAASPPTSGSDEMFDVITGTHAAMAWATGNPNPSYSDGYTNTLAPAVSPGRSCSGT